ncbi:carboxypeptidase regulatory-like domain-containing protein [Nostoc sp. UHCC 0302]|uniref:carboxypeptidase regulatory-like domain-containing protein n=1 Tax=Nostoc sp. UHCC 0302 TaxID=3134896 RepID=UPI00311C993A
MVYQTPTPPPTVTIVDSKNISCQKPVDTNISQRKRIIATAIAASAPPETLPAEFSPASSQQVCIKEQFDKRIIAQTLKTQVPSEPSASNDNSKASETSVDKNNPLPNTANENTIAEAKNLLLGIIINNQEVGSLDVVRDGNTLLLPLLDFAQLAGFIVEPTPEGIKLKTPAGVVTLAENKLNKIKGITYISDTLLKEKLATYIQFNSADLALIVDLPWRRDSGQTSTNAADLRPEVLPPSSGLSNFRQELNFYSNSGDTSWSSSTLLGGRLAGGSWRLRLDNNFVNQPDVTEYYFFKRTGQFLYQIGRQQLGLHTLLTNVNLTGVQVGYTNLPANRFNNDYGANELLPRRSQATQTFRGIVPPTSFVQLRVSGVVVAQQQVGLTGEYEFLDVNLPSGQSNEIELYIFDRNNPNVPREIRSLRLNASDLLLPSGGNVQLAGVGLSGNSIQNALFEDYNSTDSGQPVAFYQVRQGLSNNLTLEGAVQVLPETTQAQAGFAWRFANPVILAASAGTSRGQIGYTADLDVQLNRFQIIGNSEFYPSGYLYSSQSRDYVKHSLETRYNFSNNFSLGVIARSYQDQSNSTNYILPTFSLSPVSNLSLSGRPDILGRYLFNAFYQATQNSRLTFTSSGDIYSTDFSQNLSREYLVSFGTESGGDLSTRYTATLNRNAPSLSGLSWRLGLGYRDGEVGPVVGASMRLLPGLFARLDYQGIPSRYKSIYGGIGDERLTISLVSDLSFAGGRISPAEYTSIGKNRGAIAGRVIVEGGRKGFDLSESTIQVFNNRNQSFGGSAIDAQGNFFVGNLPEGVYIVQLDPDQLPVELSIKKTTVVAEVANSAVTKLDFPVRIEYGLAGRITDAAGKPIPEIEVELINAEGKRVSASATDEFGLYRLDAVPAGKYILRISPQNGITNSAILPTRDITIDKDFLYDQNLQLPISPTVKETKEPAANPQ